MNIWVILYSIMAPTLIIDKQATIKSNKLALFDLDWTLIKPKDHRKFPKDSSDWQFLFPNVISKLNKLYDDGYTVIILTNQSKDWKVDLIINVININQLE